MVGCFLWKGSSVKITIFICSKFFFFIIQPCFTKIKQFPALRLKSVNHYKNIYGKNEIRSLHIHVSVSILLFPASLPSDVPPLLGSNRFKMPKVNSPASQPTSPWILMLEQLLFFFSVNSQDLLNLLCQGGRKSMWSL